MDVGESPWLDDWTALGQVAVGALSHQLLGVFPPAACGTERCSTDGKPHKSASKGDVFRHSLMIRQK